NGRVPGPVVWRRPNQSTLLKILHNPTYAGVYGWGQRGSDPRRQGPHRRRSKPLPLEEWQVGLKGKGAAYTSWGQFEGDQAILQANQARLPCVGTARDGPALLPGLLCCGHCGARLVVTYKHDGVFYYGCCKQTRAYGQAACQLVQGRPLDHLIGDKILCV